MNNLTIVKIGGAVLTDKKGSGALRGKIIAALAAKVSAACIKKPQRLILVFGAGGRIHAMAKKYGLGSGAVTRKQVLGAIQVHMMVKNLQMKVVGYFLRHVVVVPLQTNNYFFADAAGDIQIKNLESIAALLRKKFIPVFYGDMIFHPTKNFVILSGDKICILLARALMASKVIFATDVDGVYSDSRHIGNAGHFIKNISVKKLKTLLKTHQSYKAIDTTGELPGKLREILNKPIKTKVIITNGLKPENIYQTLISSKPPGTIII